jgi:hypothetical protein
LSRPQTPRRTAHGSGTGIPVKLCRVIPEREAWLWENETANGMVDRGLRQARERELSDGPDPRRDVPPR